jgi:hypothetical protein
MFPWLFPSIATLGLSDRSYEFSASVIALRKWTYRCPYCWVSLHQRSLLDSGAAGGGAVTYCYRSLSCDGHSLVLCGCLCLLVRATSVWLECTFAEQSAVCFVPMGMRPFPFSIRVPCTHSLCRILLCESGSTCAPSFNACSISLDPFAAALRFWSLSCLTDGDCGRCLHTVIGLCGPHPRPLLLAMLCSLCGLFMLCFLRGLSVWNPAHLESAHFFAWVRSRSFADTNSLSRVFALPKKSGAIQPQSDVGHSRGYHVVGRQLLMRFRCSVSIAPVLSGIMLGGSWGFGASIRRIDFSSLGAHRVICSLKTSLQMHFGCSPDLTMLLAMLDLRHPRQNSSPSGFLYACAACSVSEFALREAGRCLVHNPQDRLQLRAQCSRRRLPLLIPQFRPFISPSSIPSVLAAALQSAVPSIAV